MEAVAARQDAQHILRAVVIAADRARDATRAANSQQGINELLLFNALLTASAIAGESSLQI
jgi:hypothetical protein